MQSEFPFQALLELVDKEIRRSVSEHEQPETLYAPMKYFMELGGKRIRPVLALLAAETVGGKPEDALTGAVAIELLHNFTLVHDDIMDHDGLRRGRETVHTRWDEGVAILTGDGLIGLAYRMLSRRELPNFFQVIRTFTAAVIEVCEGQALDKEFETREEVSLDEYFLMIRKKTAALLSMSAELGALLGGGTPEQAQSLARFGELIGMAFQVQDDLLDFLSTSKILGKQVGSDLVAGKKTFVTLTADRFLNAEQRRRFTEFVHRRSADPRVITAVRKILEEGGVAGAGRKLVEKYYQQARELLSESFPAQRIKPLEEFTDWLLQRIY